MTRPGAAVDLETAVQPAPARDWIPSEVVVVGAGLAGLTAALDLAEAGVRTTLVEKRPYPGGKTYSFADPRSAVELDNGQHVILRCCTAYRALLERLDLAGAVALQDALSVPVLDPATRRRSTIAARPARLRPPLHLAWSVLRYRHLSLRDRLGLRRALLPMLRMPEADRVALDDRTFGAWLRAHGQSEAAVERFWDLIVLATCNDHADAVSAAQAIYIFQVAFLRDAHAGDLGWPRVGLSRVADAALQRFRAAGGDVVLGRSAAAVTHDGDHVTGVRLQDTTHIPARAVLLALPPNRAAALLPETWTRRDDLSSMLTFDYAPIVNVYLHLDRPVLEDAFVAVLDPALQFVFNRSRLADLAGPGQWLAVSISAAEREAAAPRADVAATTIEALRRALPPAREAQVVAWRVVKEREATFRPRPGAARHRLGPRTALPGLLLAGAWTATDWPATMESAVRSGHAAAAAWLATRT